DPVGNLDDEYAFSIFDRHDDATANEIYGSWSHTDMSVAGAEGEWIFEMKRSLTTSDALKQDVQFTNGETIKMSVAYWDADELGEPGLGWSESGHYATCRDPETLDFSWIDVEFEPVDVLQGPEGPQGPAGLQGVQGPQGEQGSQGPQDEEEISQGNVGAGTGATVGKIFGGLRCMKSGLGTASFKSQELIIGAIVAVNCFGDVVDPESGEIIAGVLSEDKKEFANTMSFLRNFPQRSGSNFSKNTTIGAVATNAKLTKTGVTKVAMMAQDSYARTISPAHTMFDGDTIFCMATGEVEAGVNVVGAIAAEVMARAIVKAVKNTESLFKLKSYKDLF
ncbi:MAG: P1 family peptidase, partial [Candidatus Humimicrobiaceae bacterium]